MRTRILLLCIVVLAVCLWLVLHRTTGEHNVAISHETTPAITNHLSQTVQAQATKPQAASPVTNFPTHFNTEDRRKRLIEQFQEEWRTPISFYGMVVDESNNPVSDVTVQFEVNDLSTRGTSYYDTKSDENGMFSITDIRGKGMTVHVSKEGYYTSRQDNNNLGLCT